MASIDTKMNLLLGVLLNDKENESIDDLEKYILSSEHYSGNIETIDYIKDKLTEEQYEGYLLGNALKYLSRYNNKGKQTKDIRKALTYLVWLLEGGEDSTH